LFCKKVELTKKQKKYCCQSCASSHRVVLGTDNRKVIESRFCKNKECNKKFKPNLNRTVFCSRTCAKHHTKKPKKVCSNPACLNEFKPHDKTSLYCSISCANAVRCLTAKQCANPLCNKQFQPSYRMQKFCCLKCSSDAKRIDNDQ